MSNILIFCLFSCLSSGLGHGPVVWAQHPNTEPDPADRTDVRSASLEGEQATGSFKLAPGLKAALFAAEPLLANPVAFTVDEQGRFFVCETFRHSEGVTDNRSHMSWLNDDLASRTVADRVAMFRKHLSPKEFTDYAAKRDRLRRIVDTDGDGRADQATVFADGFKSVEDGIGAGVLARRGDVYYACIPKLWKFQDRNNDGKADVSKILHDGYGVHVAFLGHDLHGLRFGPDGLLYFSVGDRGLNITTPGHNVVHLDSGAVLRCLPDGSQLELFATGMRNPQELVFDELGNLFTGDNNSDGNDKARWVHVLEGGDSGWRIGYQYLESPYRRGPWNEEQLWYPHFPGQAAYIVPPLANITNGPSGLAYHPGVSLLPLRYKNHFFLCDFRGGKPISGIWSFTIKPKGASYTINAIDQFVWSVQATDADFAPDGGFYLTDWVEGWNKTGKGRIFKIFDPTRINNPEVIAVRDLIAQGFTQRPNAELRTLLSHADMRVRQEAQFALAERGDAAIADFTEVARGEGGLPTIPRLHGIWGLGQLARQSPAARIPLRALANAKDADAEVRAQVAKVLGDLRDADNTTIAALITQLQDPAPRVQMLSALALGRIGKPAASAFEPLLALARSVGESDAHLRHGILMGLLGTGTAETFSAAGKDASPYVRWLMVVIARRQGNPAVRQFLDDPDPRVALDAARAIYDTDALSSQLDALANISWDRAKSSVALLRRVVHANFRLRNAAAAQRLTDLVQHADLPDTSRLEILRGLRDWEKPQERDAVTGAWRPGPAGDRLAASAVFGPAGRALLTRKNNPTPIASATAEAIGALMITDAFPELLAVADNGQAPAPLRVAALKACGSLVRTLAATDKSAANAIHRDTLKILRDRNPSVRSAALEVLSNLDPAEALGALANALKPNQDRLVRQTAFHALGHLKHQGADELLIQALEQLRAGKLEPGTRLDLLEAAALRETPAVRKALADYSASLPSKDKDPLATYRVALEGGDPALGREIVLNRTEAACIRCHRVQGQGGEVGPALDGIAAKRERDYLLRSIVLPNSEIAEGFQTLVIVDTNGKVLTGVFKSQDAAHLRLITANAEPITIPLADIEEKRQGISAMPEDTIKHLSLRDLRDVIAFLAGLK